ncbi:MAG: hypothetical protein WC755_08830 [Candidatus Woesearchaeota archaeon]
MNKETKETLKAIVYANGFVNCSVCIIKCLSKKEIEEEVNLLNPTGLDSKWKISKDLTFRTGEKNTCQCHDNPDREHYLLDC